MIASKILTEYLRDIFFNHALSIILLEYGDFLSGSKVDPGLPSLCMKEVVTINLSFLLISITVFVLIYQVLKIASEWKFLKFIASVFCGFVNPIMIILIHN